MCYSSRPFVPRVKNSNSTGCTDEKELLGPIIIPWALEQGYYVVSTDAAGLSASFFVGLTEGRAVLDAVRAVIEYESLVGSTVALYGYSGAAHTTVWACSQADLYAGELNIVGAAFGGTPIDTRQTFYLANASPDSNIAGAALLGVANGYPDLNNTFNQQFTPQGRQIAASLRSPGNCTNKPGSVPSAPFDYTTIFHQGLGILSNSVLQGVLARESLLMNVSSQPVAVPTFPRYQYHGSIDEVVPYGIESAYVAQQCSSKQGADITFNTFKGLNHEQTLVAGLVGALQFIQQSFKGTTPKILCGSGVTPPELFSLTALELLGAATVEELAFLASLVGL